MRSTDVRRISQRKKTVLVLMGGPDAEREVSISGGREVARALLDAGKYNVVERIIDRPSLDELQAMITASAAEVVFPVLHGRWGEGGGLQELLEQIGIAYVGSQPQAASLAMNKMRTKEIVALRGVPTPPAQELDDAQTVCTIEPPLVLKPVDDGSSVDLRICRSLEDVDRGRAELHPRRGRLMAERFIRGRELTAGIVLDANLPLIEIVPAVEFYDYQAKYIRDDTRYVVNPSLPSEIAEACKEHAMLAYQALGCRDIARVDFMFDGQTAWFLEINTMPGFTTHSLVPMAARSYGSEMPGLCTWLVDHAALRAREDRESANALNNGVAGGLPA